MGCYIIYSILCIDIGIETVKERDLQSLVLANAKREGPERGLVWLLDDEIHPEFSGRISDFMNGDFLESAPL